MKKLLKGFTLIEMLVVIAIIGILAALLSGPLMKARRTAQMSKCVNNLKQIGSALLLYEDKFQDTPPTAISAGAGTYGAGETSTAANLLTLFATELQDNIQGFICPFTSTTMKTRSNGVKPDDAHATTGQAFVTTTMTDPLEYTDYNLTAGYAGRAVDRPNKIIVADSPIDGRNTATGGSIHDAIDRVTDGAVCLYTDGHTAKETNITDGEAPAGSSNNEISTAAGGISGIYEKAPGDLADAKVRTYIQKTGSGAGK